MKGDETYWGHRLCINHTDAEGRVLQLVALECQSPQDVWGTEVKVWREVNQIHFRKAEGLEMELAGDTTYFYPKPPNRWIGVRRNGPNTKLVLAARQNRIPF